MAKPPSSIRQRTSGYPLVNTEQKNAFDSEGLQNFSAVILRRSRPKTLSSIQCRSWTPYPSSCDDVSHATPRIAPPADWPCQEWPLAECLGKRGGGPSQAIFRTPCDDRSALSRDRAAYNVRYCTSRRLRRAYQPHTHRHRGSRHSRSFTDNHLPDAVAHSGCAGGTTTANLPAPAPSTNRRPTPFRVEPASGHHTTTFNQFPFPHLSDRMPNAPNVAGAQARHDFTKRPTSAVVHDLASPSHPGIQHSFPSIHSRQLVHPTTPNSFPTRANTTHRNPRSSVGRSFLPTSSPRVPRSLDTAPLSWSRTSCPAAVLHDDLTIHTWFLHCLAGFVRCPSLGVLTAYLPSPSLGPRSQPCPLHSLRSLRPSAVSPPSSTLGHCLARLAHPHPPSFARFARSPTRSTHLGTPNPTLLLPLHPNLLNPKFTNNSSRASVYLPDGIGIGMRPCGR